MPATNLTYEQMTECLENVFNLENIIYTYNCIESKWFPLSNSELQENYERYKEQATEQIKYIDGRGSIEGDYMVVGGGSIKDAYDYLYRLNPELFIPKARLTKQEAYNIVRKKCEFVRDLSNNKEIDAKKREFSLKRAPIEKNLNYLYDAAYIFPKYRNIIAISSFLEYFQSGRVYELAGPNGAYNLYENEVSLNMIITKLDTIISKLESIRTNQYMLYTAIQESKSLLESLDCKMTRANDNLNSIMNNSALIAYNTKAAADNTKAIKYLTFLNTLR